MKVLKRSFQKLDIVSEIIIQQGGLFSQTLINLDSGKKFSLIEDCKIILIDIEHHMKSGKYIKLMRSKYQLFRLHDDFSSQKIIQTNYFRYTKYDHGCIDFKKYNGLIILLQFNQLLLIKRQKIILKINQYGLRTLNQNILKILPFLFEPSEKVSISWSGIYLPILQKFKQHFKIDKDPREFNNKIKAHNNVFVLQRSPNDQFLYIAEFGYFLNNKGMIRRIIIYEKDLFIDLCIIKGMLVILIYRDYCFRLYKIHDEFILENNLICTHPDKDFTNGQIYKQWLIIIGKELKKIEINI